VVERRWDLKGGNENEESGDDEEESEDGPRESQEEGTLLFVSC